MPEFVEAGWLADVTRYITPEIKKSVFSAALEAAEYPTASGKYYGLPWYMDTKYLLYNKNILSKAGITTPPKTLDELWAQAMTIKKKGILKYPIVWNWAQQECLICDYIILTTLFGGRFVDEAGKPVFNEGGAVAALEWMGKSIDAGITGWASLAFSETDVSRALGTGDAAFALCWLSGYEVANRSESLTGACGITNVPGSDLLPEGVSVDGSAFFGVSRNCKNTDVAVELIKFWTGLSSEKSYVKWLFPMWMRLFDAPKIFREGIFDIVDIVKYQYEHMVTRPRIARYAILSKELQRAIHESLTKSKTPQEALNDAVKRLTT
jgi:multiple sugar transport system substrate-binding protein